MPLHLEFFPEPYINLNEEIQYHPELVNILAAQDSQDMHVRLSEVATYLGIMLDGTYLPEELEHLADICTKRLRAKRTIIVLPH